MAHAVDYRLVHLLGLHLELVLHVQRRCGDHRVDARPFGVPERFPGTIDIAAGRPGEPGDARILDELRDFAHGLEIAVGGDRKAGLDHVDAHLLEQQRDLDLLVEVHRCARRLLPVAQGGVENDDAIRGLLGVGCWL
jgi:hypothetical protein